MDIISCLTKHAEVEDTCLDQGKNHWFGLLEDSKSLAMLVHWNLEGCCHIVHCLKGLRSPTSSTLEILQRYIECKKAFKHIYFILFYNQQMGGTIKNSLFTRPKLFHKTDDGHEPKWRRATTSGKLRVRWCVPRRRRDRVWEGLRDFCIFKEVCG